MAATRRYLINKSLNTKSNISGEVKFIILLYIVAAMLYIGMFDVIFKYSNSKCKHHITTDTLDIDTVRLREDLLPTINTHSKRRLSGISKSHMMENKKEDLCVAKLNVDDTNTSLVSSCHLPSRSIDGTLDADVFKLNELDLPVLRNYKNPCWYERLPDNLDTIYNPSKSAFRHQARRSYDIMRPILEARQKAGQNWRLRCLPLVYIIGVAKCGTTDIFQILEKHPQITRGATKEPLFWNFRKWKMGLASIGDYLDQFDEAAETIRKNVKHEIQNGTKVAYHPMMTVDASVSYLFRFDGKNLPENKASKEGPVHLTPHFIKHSTPNAKIVLMIRNPTERLYSEYLFFHTGQNTSVEAFDAHVREAVGRMNTCLKTYHIRRCIYDEGVAGHKKSWVRLVAGMYAPFIKDWLQLFPHMMIIRTEHYHDNRAKVYEDILKYIGLDIVSSRRANGAHIVNEGLKKKVPMLQSTKDILNEFYKPFNKQLSEMMRDERYLFEDRT